jgi:hypothetical protein
LGIIYHFRTSLREFLDPVVKRFTRQTLPTVNRKHFFITILCIESTFKHRRHFDYWNKPLNMRKRVCYLDCNEAGLCCYLVIHIENRLRPLQLFYFLLWPIYWLSFVRPRTSSSVVNLGTSWSWVVRFMLRSLYHQGKRPWYPLYRRVVGPESVSEDCGKKSGSKQCRYFLN